MAEGDGGQRKTYREIDKEGFATLSDERLLEMFEESIFWRAKISEKDNVSRTAIFAHECDEKLMKEVLLERLASLRQELARARRKP